MNYDGYDASYNSYFNSNYGGFKNSLEVNTTKGAYSLALAASIEDNGDFESPDGIVEGTFSEKKDFKVGFGYSSDNYSSEVRYSYDESIIGIPHSDEHGDEHDDHDDENHDDDEDHDEHEEELSYQDLKNSSFSWKNTFNFSGSELQVTLGRNFSNRKEFGAHHEEDEHGDEDHDDDHGDDEDHDDDHDDEEHSEEEAELDMTCLLYTSPSPRDPT